MAKKEIQVFEVDVRRVRIPIVGVSPLIMHKWSEKAKAEMRAKHMKLAAQPKEAKDPEALYRESMHEHPDGGYGFPSGGFKKAMVRAGKALGMAMTDLRSQFHVAGDMVKIEGEPRMREDMVRIPGSADIRYRGEFPEWSAVLPIDYNAKAITPAQLVQLVKQAGFGTGIGEWRPERDGQYGRFDFDKTRELEEE
jgi:hypothetical protein